MLRLLFPGLTADSARGAELFRWVVTRARQAHWYAEGGVADTIDGRFAMLATIVALVLVRLERDEAGTAASVSLTERFIEAMETEHREMGLGDPKLGRTVRKLVGSLAGRVDRWRSMVERDDWAAGVAKSLHVEDAPREAVAHSAANLHELWLRLTSTPIGRLAAGRIE